MQAGRLRHYMTIQQPTEAEDANGEIIQTWSTFANVWAEILPLVGKEYWASKQVIAEATGKIRLRYIANITAKMRALFGNRILNFVGPPINIEERNIEIVIYFSERP